MSLSMHRRTFPISATVAGGAFIVQAVISPFTESHLAYHSVNAVLSFATASALLAAAREQGHWTSKPARIAAWVGVVVAAVMGAGDVIASLAELFANAEVGFVEGIAHSFVLLLLLALGVFGLTLREDMRWSGALLGAASLVLLAMVLAGLDQPEQFLVPELLVGAGWVWLAASARATDTSPA